MMLALLHSNGQLRTERDGDTEKGCHKPAVQQKTTDDVALFVDISDLQPVEGSEISDNGYGLVNSTCSDGLPVRIMLTFLYHFQ